MCPSILEAEIYERALDVLGKNRPASRGAEVIGGCALGRGFVVRVQVQRDEKLTPDRVGSLSPLGLFGTVGFGT